MKQRHVMLGVCLAALGALTIGRIDSVAVSGPGQTVYTVDADFEAGASVNLNHASPNQLQLNTITQPFPFVNVALSGRGTAVRIDVNTGVVLGEYYTAPAGMGRDPSRTTVDQLGNFWVANRGEAGSSGGFQKGSITRVGLVIGGTRNGEYVSPPFGYNTCADRDADGRIRTSGGLGHVLPWTNSGSNDTHGGVTTAADECIINYTRVRGTQTRTIAIDANNDVWTGGTNTVHEKVSGLTGIPVPGTVFSLNCGGYGGLIDRNSVLWSARFGNGLLRYVIGSSTGACLGNSQGDYGLGVDPTSGEIWHSSYGAGNVARRAPDGTVTGWFAQGYPYAQGVAVDGHGNVWVAHSLNGSSVGHLRTDGTYVGTINVGSGPTGVAVDANGKVWVTNYYSWNVVRIDPNAGPLGGGGHRVGAVDLTVPLGSSAYPYNYSDMTGFVAIGSTAPLGTWTKVHDGAVAGQRWGSIDWNAEPEAFVPPGASIEVRMRASDSAAGLGSVAFQPVANGTQFSATGRYIEVQTTLKPNAGGVSPVLSDLTVSQARCFVDADADVDRLDVALITAARNSVAAGPGDPRDNDGDRLITVNDARQCAVKCTRPSCAP